MNTRTAQMTRTKSAVITAALAGLALTLTACGGGSDNANNGSDGTAPPDINGAWITNEEGHTGDIVVIDGDSIVYIDPVAENGSSCESTTLILDDAEKGKLATDNTESTDPYQVLSTGTLNDARTEVTWDDVNGSKRTGDDFGTGGFVNLGDKLSIEYTFYRGVDDLPFHRVDGDLGKRVLADICENS